MENTKKDNETKSSILKEALIEFNQIMDAATLTAKTKLAEKYKKDFDSFLNEELEKNNSKNKINESESEKNKVIEKNTESEMKKVKENVDTEKKQIKEDVIPNEQQIQQQNNKENTPEEIDNIKIDDFPIEEVETTKNDDNDEFNININDIEKEIDDMEKMSTQIEDSPSEENKEIDAYAKLKVLYDQIGKVIGDLESIHDNSEVINKETEKSVEPEVKSSEEKPVEEIYSQGLSANKRADSATSPRPEYFPEKENKLRIALRNELGESFNKKLTSFINENKKNVKELNNLKKTLNNANKLVENYKIALEKYRTQLSEMATFNTNLANVNNILLDESLALTKEDKIKIINEFKQIKSITESEEKYKQIIDESKQIKKPLTENIENKISVSVESSSKNILDESIEKNKNNSNNAGLDKIKKNINYIENRNKKN